MNYNSANYNTTLEMINKLQSTNSNKEKLAILKSYVGHEDEETIKTVLEYCYNPFKKYKITEEVYNNVPLVRNTIFSCPFEMLDTLASSNINDLLRLSTKAFIENNIHAAYYDLFKGILFKDLKLGVNAKSINKVWKGLVPEFNVQLAESYAKKQPKEGEHFYLTTKLDGFRLICMPNEDGSYTYYTRKGEEYEGVNHLDHDVDLISGGKYVLDGELIARNDDNLTSGDLYKVTSKIARKKGNTPEKVRLEFHVFDIIPKEEFLQGESKWTYGERREFLENIFTDLEEDDYMNVKKVEVLYKGTDQNVISDYMSEVTSQGGEGLMLNITNSTYQCKRNKGVLKLKEFKEADVYVKGVYEGTGRNKGRLGGVYIQFLHNGELHECECGSGFTDKQRVEYWASPELIVDKVVVVNYFEATSNQKGSYGLRFPTFSQRIRDDKEFEDITDVQEG